MANTTDTTKATVLVAVDIAKRRNDVLVPLPDSKQKIAADASRMSIPTIPVKTSGAAQSATG